MLSGVPQNEPKTTQYGGPRPPRWPKMTPGAFQNEPKRHPRGSKKRARIARRQKVGTRTMPGPPWIPPGGGSRSLVSPQGRHLGLQNDTQTDPKPIKNRSENSRRKKGHPRRSWTHLGAILGRSWPHLGVNLGQKPLENVMFREKSLFRR